VVRQFRAQRLTVDLLTRELWYLQSIIESRAPGGDEPQSRPGLRLEP